MLSFVLLPNGNILDGTPFSEVMARIDDEVATPPDHYMINCVHARNFASAMSYLIDAEKARVIGLEANTSSKTPDELDKLEEIDTQTPEDFGRDVWALRHSVGSRYLAGCCGSGTEHIEALVENAMRELNAA